MKVGTSLEKLSNQVLVHDVTLKLDGRYLRAVAELEMFDKKRGAVELLTAAEARELLIDSMGLLWISICSALAERLSKLTSSI